MEPPEQPKHAPRALSSERAPARAVLELAWPITLSGLSFAIMGVVDTVFVSGLGASQLAGVGLGVVVTHALMGFGLGLMRGVKILLAQARGLGVGAQASARAYIGAGVMIALWLGLTMALLGELAAFVAPRFAASAEAGEAARAYIAVRSLGIPIILVYVALREARYGLGETRSPMISAILGNLSHALLDYVALYVLHWGAAGAALANVGAFALQAGLLLFVQLRDGGLSLGAAERAAQGAVLRAGTFTGLQWALEISSLGTLSVLLAGVSDQQMAAHQMAVQLTAFSFLPALAIAEAASLLVAEAVGRGRMALVNELARAARTVALGYAALCAFVFVGFGGLIARLFSDDPGLCALARTLFLFAAVHQLLESTTMAGHGVLRGVGAQRFSALTAIGCAWGCTPLLGFVLARVLGFGVQGAWIARALEMATASTILWWHIGRNGWREAARDAARDARVHRAHAKA